LSSLSSGHRIATLQPILTLDIPFPDHVLQEIDFPSKFDDLACSILRLRGDTRCYKVLDNLVYQIKWKCNMFILHFSIDFRTIFYSLVNWTSIMILAWQMQADRARGEDASCISCYMKENPESTEEDALNHINAMIEAKIKELNWELCKPNSNVPISSKKHAFGVSRALHHLYNYRDGFSVADIETKNLVMRTVLEPVHM